MKKQLRFPKPKPRRNLILQPPQTPADRQAADLTADLREIAPRMIAAGFQSFVVLGYRRLPADERQAQGAPELPFMFQCTPDMKTAGALVNDANDALQTAIRNQTPATETPK